MALDWVGTAVAGIVGLGGIAGTLITTHLQQRGQRDAAELQRKSDMAITMREERKAAYVRFLQSVSGVISCFDEVRTRRPEEPDIKRMTQAVAELQILHPEIQLVGHPDSETIAVCTWISTHSFLLSRAVATIDADKANKAITALLLLQAELWLCMREDLREVFDPERSREILEFFRANRSVQMPNMEATFEQSGV